MVGHWVAQDIELRTLAWHSTFHFIFSITQQQNISSFLKERRVILATEAIQNNRNLSRRQAARIYEVPEATLRSRMNGRILRDDSRHGW